MEEVKIEQAKRRAFIFDIVVVLLALAIFMQVAMPAVVPVVQAMKGETPAPVVQAKAKK